MLQLYLPDWQAQVLTSALTRAWKIVLDENRPIWQRADVLVGIGIGLVLLLALTSLGLSPRIGRLDRLDTESAFGLGE